MVEIKNHESGAVISSGETLRTALQASKGHLVYADLSGVDLRDVDLGKFGLGQINLYKADLSGARLNHACLSLANLSRVNLRGADLSGAVITAADLGYADLEGVNLSEAICARSYFCGANLCNANLSGVNFHWAELRGVNLEGASLSWRSHELLAEVLRQAANGDVEKIKIAGLLLIGREMCWNDFMQLAASDPLGDWALNELAKWAVEKNDSLAEWVTENDVESPPKQLLPWVAKLADQAAN